MASMSNYLETALINHIFRGVAYTGPATIAVCLCTAAPSDADTGALLGKEVSGGGYARVGVSTSGGTEWAAAAGGNGTTLNINQLVFTPATADWGTITHVALCDSTTAGAGNLLFWAPLTASRVIQNGDTFVFDPDSVSCQLDN
jgi:hypothetical protein